MRCLGTTAGLGLVSSPSSKPDISRPNRGLREEEEASAGVELVLEEELPP